MIKLKPNPEAIFNCPECEATHAIINKIIIESVYPMADCRCTNCGYEFYQSYPVGHASLNVFSIGKLNGKFYQGKNEHTWLSESFIHSQKNSKKNAVPVRKIIYKQYKKVVILNTLDSLYGHVLLKLYNAFRHIEGEPDIGLIIIAPKIFEWLIPAGCAEAWLVDLKLSELINSHEGLEKFISLQFDRFDEIYLSKAYSHPMITDEQTEQLTRIAPFNLTEYKTNNPTVTFVLREDRFWFASIFDYWLYRLCRKLNWLTWGNKILAKRQVNIVRKVITEIKKRFASIEFYVVGLGNQASFEGYAIDERTTKMDALVEARWCKIYSKSHVVIGVHGSNMLLPTALAAGCVEILPEDRYGNMVQDITVRYSDRRQLFFYRFVNQYTHSRSVANMAEAIIRDYSLYKENMCANDSHVMGYFNDQSNEAAMMPVMDK